MNIQNKFSGKPLKINKRNSNTPIKILSDNGSKIFKKSDFLLNWRKRKVFIMSSKKENKTITLSMLPFLVVLSIPNT